MMQHVEHGRRTERKPTSNKHRSHRLLPRPKPKSKAMFVYSGTLVGSRHRLSFQSPAQDVRRILKLKGRDNVNF